MIESSFLPPDVPGLIAALAIGLLIGLERGWHDRELPRAAE
ncbi:MgtC/SapB family protein [Acinetobacter seifertii]|nr:MgtC/SapB family protein [Acinetobacter seifertii]